MVNDRAVIGGRQIGKAALFLFIAAAFGICCGRPATVTHDTAKASKAELSSVSAGWESPRNLLTVNQARFTQAVRQRGWDQGTWYILLVSPGCGDCYTALRAMNQWAEMGRQCVAVGHEMEDPQFSEAFKQQIAGLNLGFPVRILSGRQYREMGAMIVPTLVVVVDGKWTKAMDVSLGFPPAPISEKQE